MADIDTWILWWSVGAAVVLIAALLLVWIWIAARGIEREAQRALTAARRLESSTRPLWRLGEMRKALDTARPRLEGE